MLASDEVQPQSPYCNPGKRVKELTTENYEKSLKNRFRRIRMQEPSEKLRGTSPATTANGGIAAFVRKDMEVYRSK